MADSTYSVVERCAGAYSSIGFRHDVTFVSRHIHGKAYGPKQSLKYAASIPNHRPHLIAHHYMPMKSLIPHPLLQTSIRISSK